MATFLPDKKPPAHLHGDGVWHLQVAYRAHSYPIKAESAIEKDKSTNTNEIATEEHLVSVPQRLSSEDYLPKSNPDGY